MSHKIKLHKITFTGKLSADKQVRRILQVPIRNKCAFGHTPDANRIGFCSTWNGFQLHIDRKEHYAGHCLQSHIISNTYHWHKSGMWNSRKQSPTWIQLLEAKMRIHSQLNAYSTYSELADEHPFHQTIQTDSDLYASKHHLINSHPWFFSSFSWIIQKIVRWAVKIEPHRKSKWFYFVVDNPRITQM